MPPPSLFFGLLSDNRFPNHDDGGMGDDAYAAQLQPDRSGANIPIMSRNVKQPLAIDEVETPERPRLGKREQGLADRRRRLIRAAAELIEERENGVFSMSDLAARAGLSLATPYNLIGSKAEVLSQLFTGQVRSFHGDNGWMQGLSPAQRMIGLVNRLVAALSKQERYFRNLWKALYGLGANEHGKFPFPESGHLMAPLVEGLVADGLLPAEIPADILDMTLQQIFDSLFGYWAAQDWPMDRLHRELSASFALVFYGFSSEADREVLSDVLKRNKTAN